MSAWGTGRIKFDPEAAGWTGITDDDRKLWVAAYPTKNVAQELLRAAAWTAANPNKRKRNYARFLVNWLNRSQGYHHDNTTTNRPARPKNDITSNAKYLA